MSPKGPDHSYHYCYILYMNWCSQIQYNR
jgi:hypothetical protein